MAYYSVKIKAKTVNDTQLSNTTFDDVMAFINANVAEEELIAA